MFEVSFSQASNLNSFFLLVSALLSLVPEKAMAPYSSTLAWKSPWMEEPGRLQSIGSLRVRHDWVTSLSLFTFMHWRSKWQPLQYSCVENPRDGGAWWVAIYGVAQSWTWLKRLSSSSSRVFLISVIVLFVSVCLFFNSFRSLFLHLLHFVFKVFDNLYSHYSEFFFR